MAMEMRRTAIVRDFAVSAVSYCITQVSKRRLEPFFAILCAVR